MAVNILSSASKHNPEKNELVDALQDWDEKVFAEKKEKLFQEIQKLWESLGSNIQEILVQRIREYDIEDGLKLCERLQYTPYQYEQLLSSPPLQLKYSQLWGKIMDNIWKHKDKLHNGKMYSDLLRAYKFYQEEMKKGNSDTFVAADMVKEHSKKRPFYEQIDELYTPLLRTTQFKLEENVDPRSRGERLGEEYLENVSHLNHYITDKIIAYIYDKIIKPEQKDWEKAEWFYEKQEAVQNLLKKRKLELAPGDSLESIFLSDKSLLVLCYGLDLDPNDPALEEARYKPLNLTFNMKNSLAEKYNKEELLAMLQRTHGEEVQVVWNEEKKAYEVKMPEGAEGKGEVETRTDTSWLDLQWKAIPYGDDFIIKTGDTDFGDKRGKQNFISSKWRMEGLMQATSPISVKDWIASTFKAWDKRFVKYESGENGEFETYGKYDRIGKMKDINGKLYYIACKDWNWNIYEGNKPILVTEQEDEIYDFSITKYWPIRRTLWSGSGKYQVHRINEDGDSFTTGMFNKMWELKAFGDGKVAYCVYYHDKRELNITDGEHRKEIEGISNIYDIKENSKGEIMMIVEKDGEKEVWQKRDSEWKWDLKWNKYFREFDEIGDTIAMWPQKVIADRFVFKVKQFLSGVPKYFLYNEDGSIWYLPDGYNISDPIKVGDSLVFGIEKNGKWKIFDGTNRIIRDDEYDEIYFIKEYQWGLHFCARQGEIIINHKEGKTTTTELTPEEQEKLNFLNLCVPLKDRQGELKAFQTKIFIYFFVKAEEEKKKGSWKEKAKLAKSHLAGINQLIKTYPQLFIDTISPFKVRNADRLADQIILRIFPEIFQEEKKRGRWNGEGWSDEGGGNYFQDTGTEGLEGGNPETSGSNPIELMELRDEIPEMLITNILGHANADNGARSRLDLPLATSPTGPRRETSITIPHPQKGATVLPKSLSATLIPQRIKGIKKGKEEHLEGYTNALGISAVNLDQSFDQLKYSLTLPTLAPRLENVNAPQYETFKKSFAPEWKEEILSFDREVDIFLAKLKDQPLLDQLEKIESYVREHAFYDMKNGEVNGLKRWKSNQDRLFICEERIEELKAKSPELAPKLAGKKRAGVCADFALITTAMLRQVGILSGVAVWFLPSGKKITTANAHWCSFAIVPTGKKGNQIVLIDGTPHGSSVQPLASLREREEEQTKQLQELEEKTLQELTKLTEITEQYKDDPQALKELLQPLYNGNLEDAMNAILQHQITPHHHQRILNLLNAYRYAPLPEKTSKAELQEFLVKEMEADSVSQQATPESGTQLFGEVQSFVKKVSKDKKNLPPFEVLDTLIETVQPALDQPEYLALLLISKYLKAEKMFR